MLEVILFGVVAGLDNLQVCSSLGLLPMERKRLHLFAMAFCLCELGGAVLGLQLGRSFINAMEPLGTMFAPAMMLLCGLAVIFLAYRNAAEGLPRFVNRRAVLFVLPVSLSVDNVVAGAGISFSSTPVLASAVAIGVISATMSCFGLYFANWVRNFLPKRVEMIAGAYMCLLAVRMMYS